MAPGKKKCVPKLKLTFWKLSNTGYSAVRSDIFAAIEKSGHTQEQIVRRMGAGIAHLNDLIDGMELDLWSAWFVDSALEPDEPKRPSHSYPPREGAD